MANFMQKNIFYRRCTHRNVLQDINNMLAPPVEIRKMWCSLVRFAGAYAGFLKGGATLKISVILDIHAAKRHVASSEAASLT